MGWRVESGQGAGATQGMSGRRGSGLNAGATPGVNEREGSGQGAGGPGSSMRGAESAELPTAERKVFLGRKSASYEPYL
jgi:hypothetical protein